jgi:hypothetical protein
MSETQRALPACFVSSPTISIMPKRFILQLASRGWSYSIVYLFICFFYSLILAWAIGGLFGFVLPNIQSVGIGVLVISTVSLFLNYISRDRVFLGTDHIAYQQSFKRKIEVPYTEIGKVSITGAKSLQDGN